MSIGAVIVSKTDYSEALGGLVVEGVFITQRLASTVRHEVSIGLSATSCLDLSPSVPTGIIIQDKDDNDMPSLRPRNGQRALASVASMPLNVANISQ